jgi:hypothetical protein
MTHLAARAPARNSPHLGLIIVIEPTGSGDLFTARLNGRLLCKCRTPFCTAARLLLERGYAPGTLVVMRHAGSSTNATRRTGLARYYVEWPWLAPCSRARSGRSALAG